MLEMNAAELRKYQDLQELPEIADADLEDWVMCDDVLDGTQGIEISHEGGEFTTLKDMQEEWATRWVSQYQWGI